VGSYFTHLAKGSCLTRYDKGGAPLGVLGTVVKGDRRGEKKKEGHGGHSHHAERRHRNGGPWNELVSGSMSLQEGVKGGWSSRGGE